MTHTINTSKRALMSQVKQSTECQSPFRARRQQQRHHIIENRSSAIVPLPFTIFVNGFAPRRSPQTEAVSWGRLLTKTSVQMHAQGELCPATVVTDFRRRP